MLPQGTAIAISDMQNIPPLLQHPIAEVHQEVEALIRITHQLKVMAVRNPPPPVKEDREIPAQ